MSSRTFAVVFVAVAVIAVGALAAAVLTRDDLPAVTGDLIAYSCKEKGNPWFAICVIRADGTESRRLTTGLPATDPAWSPDGRKIAFTRREDVGGGYTTFSEDDVLLMNSDSGGSRQLTEELDNQHAGQPAWSPDGREIVFMRGAPVPTALPARPGELFIMDVEDPDARPLTRGSRDLHPAWSPDGREIAFTRAVEPLFAGIWAVGVAGGQPRRLTGLPGHVDESAAWSPDGTRIAFTRTRPESELDGAASVYIMGRDGTNLRELVRHRYFSCCTYGLAWSPDGRTIAFETSPSRLCTAVSLVDVASGRIRPLTSCTSPRESALSPAWQPDTRAEEG
jgi:TolB protein